MRRSELQATTPAIAEKRALSSPKPMIMAPSPPNPLPQRIVGGGVIKIMGIFMRTSTPEYVKELARQSRKKMTPAEKLLWERLINNQLDGHKFYRQCPLGRYIADFFCGAINLVIELDGGIHEEYRQMEYDKVRQSEIEGRKMIVLRFPNELIINNYPSHNTLGEGQG
jgi:very-short-patch-repair endonuclease